MDPTTPLPPDGRRVLAGRYELRGLLGRGGMADVELAYDRVLDRQVAVKLLHDRYAGDPAFRQRFQREARAAASLNHPNMVAVYDTGEEDGRPFIVMEYVAGRSLRDVLRREGVLPTRAAEITADAAAALHYAHERGLVHRDVKPANIMLSDEGQVKVTDFGIARAVDAETITQTAAVFGTAAYIAPEQAQGGEVDGRTDVYGLGVVLYEMLTGRPPFAADSPVALAYKHVSEAPIPPSQLNPEVSPELEAVVLTALAKNPDDRYPTAKAFGDDLRRALEGLAVAAAPAAAYAATRVLAGDDPTLVAGGPPPSGPTAVYEEEEVEPPERRRGFGWVLLLLLVLAAFALAGWLLVQLLASQAPNLVEVPDVEGKRLSVAQNELRDAGFETVVADEVNDPRVERGRVVSTDPAAGERVEQGSLVRLTVSLGPALTEVPDVVGMPEDEAVDALRDANLRIGDRAEDRSDDVDPGAVIATSPSAGSEVEERTRVDLVVSEGPATVAVPTVRGQPRAEAEETLRSDCGDEPCLEVVVERRYDDEIARGDAVGTEPGAGARVDYGATVTLVISRGPEPEPEPEPEPSPEPTATEPPTELPTEVPTDGSG